MPALSSKLQITTILSQKFKHAGIPNRPTRVVGQVQQHQHPEFTTVSSNGITESKR